MVNKGTAKGLFLGMVAGTITGGIIALLYAPKSGKELRKDIGIKKDELIEDAEKYLEMSKSRASEIITDGRNKAEEMIDNAKRKIGTLKHYAGDVIATGKDMVSKETHKVKDAVEAGYNAYNENMKTDVNHKYASVEGTENNSDQISSKTSKR